LSKSLACPVDEFSPVLDLLGEFCSFPFSSMCFLFLLGYRRLTAQSVSLQRRIPGDVIPVIGDIRVAGTDPANLAGDVVQSLHLGSHQRGDRHIPDDLLDRLSHPRVDGEIAMGLTPICQNVL
jgi:hypothetical protein